MPNFSLNNNEPLNLLIGRLLNH